MPKYVLNMRTSCVKTVHTFCTTCARSCGLSAGQQESGYSHVGNNSNNSTVMPQLIPLLSTGLWVKSTTVIRAVIHAIHRTNKDNHKLVLHKLYSFYYITGGQPGAIS